MAWSSIAIRTEADGAGVPTGFGRRARPSQGEDLARIEDVERIERRLDRAHRVERRLAVLGLQIFHLALTDTMLAGAGAAHRQCAVDQAFEQILGALDLGQ